MARQFNPHSLGLLEKLGVSNISRYQPKEQQPRRIRTTRPSVDNEITKVVDAIESKYKLSTSSYDESTCIPSVSVTDGYKEFKMQQKQKASKERYSALVTSPPRYRVSSTHKKSMDLDLVDSGGYAEKPRKNIKSPNFRKERGRHNSLFTQYDVHENRFIRFHDSPVVFSKVRRPTAPNMKLTLGRKGQPDYKSPVYEVKYDLVSKDTSKAGVTFEKRKGRDNIFVVPMNDLDYEGLNYDYIDSKVSSPDIKKNMTRPSHKTLPAFMLV